MREPPDFRERRQRELRRIPLPRTWVNSPLAFLRTCPLHAVHHLLGLGQELVEIASQAAEADSHRLTLHVLQDDKIFDRYVSHLPDGSTRTSVPDASTAPRRLHLGQRS